MRAKHWLAICIVALLADIFTLHLNQHIIRLITKPMIVLPLIGLVLSRFTKIKSSRKYLLLFALLSAWVGDIVLIFATKSNNLYLIGIFSFLIAQILYSALFLQFKKKHSNWLWLTGIVCYSYGILLFLFFKPHLDESLKTHVMVYMLIICTMLILSFHIEKSVTQKLIALGAVLFILSDTLLANQMFYRKWMLGDQVLMILYGLAQMLITIGVIEHLETMQFVFNRAEGQKENPKSLITQPSGGNLL